MLHKFSTKRNLANTIEKLITLKRLVREFMENTWIKNHEKIDLEVIKTHEPLDRRSF